MLGWGSCSRSRIEGPIIELSKHRNLLVRELAGIFPDHCALPVGRAVSFPGLSACDTAVLGEALRVDESRPEAWWIEAPVGDLPNWVTSGASPGWWRAFGWQYQLRCDVVTVTGDEVRVIEIKGEVRTSAVGQVLVYTFLLQRRLGSRVDVQPRILGRSCLPEVRDFCRATGIHVWTLDEIK